MYILVARVFMGIDLMVCLAATTATVIICYAHIFYLRWICWTFTVYRSAYERDKMNNICQCNNEILYVICRTSSLYICNVVLCSNFWWKNLTTCWFLKNVLIPLIILFALKLDRYLIFHYCYRNIVFQQ